MLRNIKFQCFIYFLFDFNWNGGLAEAPPPPSPPTHHPPRPFIQETPYRSVRPSGKWRLRIRIFIILLVQTSRHAEFYFRFFSRVVQREHGRNTGGRGCLELCSLVLRAKSSPLGAPPLFPPTHLILKPMGKGGCFSETSYLI